MNKPTSTGNTPTPGGTKAAIIPLKVKKPIPVTEQKFSRRGKPSSGSSKPAAKPYPRRPQPSQVA